MSTHRTSTSVRDWPTSTVLASISYSKPVTTKTIDEPADTEVSVLAGDLHATTWIGIRSLIRIRPIYTHFLAADAVGRYIRSCRRDGDQASRRRGVGFGDPRFLQCVFRRDSLAADVMAERLEFPIGDLSELRHAHRPPGADDRRRLQRLEYQRDRRGTKVRRTAAGNRTRAMSPLSRSRGSLGCHRLAGLSGRVCSILRMTLPLLVFGTSQTNCQASGTLYGASRSRQCRPGVSALTV